MEQAPRRGWLRFHSVLPRGALWKRQATEIKLHIVQWGLGSHPHPRPFSLAASHCGGYKSQLPLFQTPLQLGGTYEQVWPVKFKRNSTGAFRRVYAFLLKEVDIRNTSLVLHSSCLDGICDAWSHNRHFATMRKSQENLRALTLPSLDQANASSHPPPEFFQIKKKTLFV